MNRALPPDLSRWLVRRRVRRPSWELLALCCLVTAALGILLGLFAAHP